MAVLGGVDSTNDELGCQETARIQEGVWEGLPPPEESHDTVSILNCAIHISCVAAEGVIGVVSSQFEWRACMVIP